MATFDPQLKELESASDYVDKVVCQPCITMERSNLAKMFCLECQQYMCTKCIAYHKAFKVTESHALVTLGEMSNNPKMKKDRCSKKCTVHKDKTVKYFCDTHSVLGCSRCAINEHKQCTVVTFIPSIAGNLESDSEFKHFTENLTSLDTKAKILAAAIENTLKQLDIEPKQILEAIQRAKNDVIAKLEDLEEKMTRQVESLKKEQTNKLRTLSKTFKVTRISVEHLKHEIDTLLENSQYCDAYVLMKTQTSKLQELKNKIEEACKMQVKNAAFRPKVSQIGTFGDLDIHEAPVVPNINLTRDLTRELTQVILRKGSGLKDFTQDPVGTNTNLPGDVIQQFTQVNQGKGSRSNETSQVQERKDVVIARDGKKLDGPLTAQRLRVGSRVKIAEEHFNPFDNLNGEGIGTVERMPRNLRTGKVEVKWDDTGDTLGYLMGQDGKYMLELID